MSVKKSVLVLGGGGFIGINIARRLLYDGGYDITVADRGFRGRLERHFPHADEQARLTVIEDDFSKAAAYDRLAPRYDHVYMMAAIVGVNRTLAHPEEVIRVNTALVHHTLAWLQRADVGRLVFASSSENYAAATDLFGAAIPTPETVPLVIGDIRHPRWTYAVTKILGESAFLHTGPKAGVEATIVRYQNAFGPDMGFRHAIPHIVQRFHQGQEPYLIYGAEQTRAFCYITDTVDGTIRAMETPRAAGEIYHIGNDVEITMRTLTHAVGELMGYHGEYADAPTYPGSVERRCPDITKSQSDLGYAPAVPWREGLRRTVEWYREFFASGRVPDDAGFEPPEKFQRQAT
jgi:UDP-glucose 4-epimerase